MKLTPELYCLTLVATMTVLMWIPYTVARIVTRGLWPALANPDPSFAPDPAWAERARRAHANAAENLVVFAPLVIIAGLIGASSPATIMAAQLFLGARITHFLVYTAGIPVLRTVAFVAGVVATMIFAAAILANVA